MATPDKVRGSIGYTEILSPGAGIGPVGPQGCTGVTGGLQGATGAKGATGLQGIQGDQGATGAQGNPGTPGYGTQGVTGLRGFTGLQGSYGQTGLRGITGANVIGATGAQGQTGIAGTTFFGTTDYLPVYTGTGDTIGNSVVKQEGAGVRVIGGQLVLDAAFPTIASDVGYVGAQINFGRDTTSITLDATKVAVGGSLIAGYPLALYGNRIYTDLGDIDSSGWISYSSTVPQDFSTINTKVLKYRRIYGKLYQINFYVDGTSSGLGFKFDLPWNLDTSGTVGLGTAIGYDGTSSLACEIRGEPGGFSYYADIYHKFNDPDWPTYGRKAAMGSFFAITS